MTGLRSSRRQDRRHDHDPFHRLPGTVTDAIVLLDFNLFGGTRPPLPAAGDANGDGPEAVARKLVRLLSSSSDQSAMPGPEDAKIAELKASVESVEDGVAILRFTGRWEMMHLVEVDAKRPTYGAATAEGSAVYDLQRESMRSLLLVFTGTIRSGRPDAPFNRTGAVAEWRAK